jgi:hypothetical protein
MFNCWKKMRNGVKLSPIKLAENRYFRYKLIAVEKRKFISIKTYLL